jgi:hypothetical protein
MHSRICLCAGLVTVAACYGGAAVFQPYARTGATPGADCYRVQSERFDFHSDLWINLHHFLFQWARASSQPKAGDSRPRVEVPEMEQLRDLTESERQAWDRAVAYYRERLIDGNLLFDRPLIALRGRLGALACAAGGETGVDPELWQVLADAMPVYRGHWWPRHHAANVAWIEERMGQLRSYETVLAKRLAEAYGGEWPPERVRVDVAAYSNWAGAYTTNNPNQLTISSRDYTGLEGLEILFHEVSHASFFEQRLFGQLATAFRAHGGRPPGRLFHVIQFVTPAVLMRSVLGSERLAGYRSIAERVNAKGSTADQYRVVVKEWTPFLDGKVTRTEALDRIAATLVQPKSAK